MRAAFLVITLCTLLHPSDSRAQEDTVQIGIQAYLNLEFQRTRRIRNSLAYNASIAEETRMTALSYLAATNVFLGQESAAEIVYCHLLIQDPTFRPDQLMFPPEVTSFFEDVRKGTRVVRALFDESIVVEIGMESVLVDIVSSSEHSVVVEMHYAGGTAYARLFR